MNKNHKWSEEIRGIETDVEKLRVMLEEISQALTHTQANLGTATKVLEKLFDEHAPETKK